MMQEMIIDLLSVGDKKEKEKVYRRLERIGVDRVAADKMASELYKSLIFLVTMLSGGRTMVNSIAFISGQMSFLKIPESGIM